MEEIIKLTKKLITSNKDREELLSLIRYEKLCEYRSGYNIAMEDFSEDLRRMAKKYEQTFKV